MHWLVWAFIACIVFLITYNPRTGSLGKFLDLSQSESDNKSSEKLRETESAIQD